jgi:2'-hydroxyisoflavone reductase
MKLLVLGGTRFLGRHLVDAALARGHDVTIFTRGVTPLSPGAAVRQLVGNRDPRVAPGLAALAAGEWDAAIDTSGYVPRCVKAAAEALAGRIGHYTFVSSLSVYADASRPGIDETAPVATLEDPSSEDVKAHYGALKACCEEEIRAVFRDRALVVRPGLIVGPFDPTDRFAYWVARFRRPGLLGARGEAALVPGPRDRPVQFIDARDLATWILDGVEAGRAGPFNACSPEGLWTMGALVDALVAGGGAGSAPVPAWVDDATLVGCGIVPWTGLPLWIPATDPESAAFMDFACARAIAHGLAIRPLAQTIDDISAWLGERDNSDAWRNVLSAEKEREALAGIGPEPSGSSPAATGVRS